MDEAQACAPVALVAQGLELMSDLVGDAGADCHACGIFVDLVGTEDELSELDPGRQRLGAEFGEPALDATDEVVAYRCNSRSSCRSGRGR